MGFLTNKKTRNGGTVLDRIANLRMRHNAIIEQRRKDREAAMAAKKAQSTTDESPTPSVSSPSSPARSSVAELDFARSSTPSSSAMNSVAELDSVCPKSPSKSIKMPSVAEWLLWGDDESQTPQQPKQNQNRRSTSPSKRGSAASPSRSPARSSPSASPKAGSAPSDSPPNISESHSFDNSQFDSHFYSEFTDDFTVDDSLADVTLASSKEPGLFAHGLMAVGELFTGTPVPPVTPSPQRRRKPHTIDEGDDESDDDDESTQAYSTYARDEACLRKYPLARSQSANTATTASSSPSSGFGEIYGGGGARRNAPVKYHHKTNVNIIESSEMEFEMSLETVTRIEI